jgi:hypothetical protein
MNRAKNLLTLWGPDDSFQFNPMLLQNIIKSPYFQKCCKEISDWNALVDEIYYSVKHLEPWTVGTYLDLDWMLSFWMPLRLIQSLTLVSPFCSHTKVRSKELLFPPLTSEAFSESQLVSFLQLRSTSSTELK